MGQAFWRHIQNNGLQRRYESDADFALQSLQSRHILALASVPEAKVLEAFEEVADNFPQEAVASLDYFEDNYVGRCRNPTFPILMVHDHVKDDLPRTNNSVEDW